MNKKLLFTTTLFFLFNITPSFADLKDTIYLKAGIGLYSMNEINDLNKLMHNTSTIEAPPSIGPIASLAVGCNLIGILRADLELSYLSNIKLGAKGVGSVSIYPYNNKGTITHQANITSLLANFYLNIIDLSKTKIFAGFGVGASTFSEKITFEGALYMKTMDDKIFEYRPYKYEANTKKTTNFTYSITLGAEFRFTSKLGTELAYSYRDYGKTTSIKIANNELANSHYRGHHLILGLKYYL